MEGLVVITQHTPRKCVRVSSVQRHPAIRDNHDSWGMCTTSAECKTVITAVLTVKSGMDPHMISWEFGTGWSGRHSGELWSNYGFSYELSQGVWRIHLVT